MVDTYGSRPLFDHPMVQDSMRTLPVGPPPDATLAEHKRRIVSRIKAGPALCREIDRLTPARGQAVVGMLRSEGHEIRTVTIDGGRYYVYEGFDGSRVSVRDSMREAYYASQHWRDTARARKELDGWKCQQCGATDNLETHHWRYQLFCEDVQCDLITLCKTCHEDIHEAISGGKCHFPRHVNEDVARRLGWKPKNEKQ